LFDSENQEAESGYVGGIEVVEDRCCSYEWDQGQERPKGDWQHG